MKDALIVSALSLVPKNHGSRLQGWAARLRLPAVLHKALVGWFAGRYGADLTECVGSIEDFDTLGDFFIRELKPGVRPVDPDPDAVVSPCDGTVHTFGPITAGAYIQSEGQTASVADLLGATDPRIQGRPSLDPARYEGGQFAILYLSPKDYHRVHSPLAGTVRSLRYLAGQLWPVFPVATQRVPGLFGRNERLVFELDTDFGTVAAIMVGAYGVGRMSTDLHPRVTNDGGASGEVALAPAPTVERAGELGRFELGSTVILLFEPGQVEWELVAGTPCRLGARIGRRVAG